MVGTWPSKGLPSRLSGRDLPANAADAGSIPGSGRAPGGGNANHSSILAWRSPRREEPGGLESLGSQAIKHNGATNQQHHDPAEHLFSLAQLPVGFRGTGLPPAQTYVNLRGFRPRKLWGRLAMQHHLAYSDRLCPSGSAPRLVNTVVFIENSVTFLGAFIPTGYLTGIKRQNPGNDSDHKDCLFF